MPATATVAPKPPAQSPAKAAGPKPVPPKPVPPKPDRAKPLPAFARAAAGARRGPLAPLAARGEGGVAGAPLAPHVQEAVENSLGVDLHTVRVHSGSAAQKKAKSLSARAFTFGSDIVLGEGEHESDLALMAHEAAHVVQQQSAPAVQTWSSDRGDSYEREADRASSAVERGESFTVRERVSTPRLQRLGIKDALDYFADAAYNIPGYRMFTIIIGVNPINMEHVERSPANILRAAVEFIPGGHLITQALDQYSVFDKVGAWVQQQLDTLSITGSSIKKALDTFLDSLSWRDIFHLGDVWDRAKRIFSEPIDQIKNLLVGLLEGIWKFVREAILKPIAKLAEGTAGWDLLVAVLGKNPITGEEVKPTADKLIGGFMKLIHQEEIWENIKKANAIDRALKWFTGALTGLIGFVTQIPTLFITALKSLSWTDIIDLPAGFMKVAGVFGKFLVSFITWAGNTIWDLLQIIFEVVAPGAMPYLKKVGAALKTIFKNPIGFVKNLVAAGKLGFEMFVSNIGAHLKASFIEWLTGSLPGVYIPKALDLKEILKFVLSVLGLTWQNIRGKLVKVVGETAVKAMETGFDIVVTLVKDGPAAAWEKIKESVGDLKEMVMQSIMNFVIETVVKKAVAKVVSLLIPGGAFIQAIISIYDTIMVFVDKLAKIIQVVKSFLDSMMQIAAGAIGAAAAKVESTLAGLLTLAINFLAGFIGLGKVADKVMEIINKIRAPIDKALDKVIDWIVTMAKKLFTKVFGKDKDKDKKPELDPETQKKLDAGLAAIDTAQVPLEKDGKLAEDGATNVVAQVKSAHPVFKSLSARKEGDHWLYEYVVNPPGTKAGAPTGVKTYLGASQIGNNKGQFKGTFGDPAWNWNGYPTAATPHPANKYAGSPNGSTLPQPTGDYQVVGDATSGNISTQGWRDKIDAERDKAKAKLRKKNPTWSDGDLENGAKGIIEVKYGGMGWKDLYLLDDWDQHHIKPINWSGPNNTKNMQYLRRSTEHSPVTGWWTSRKAEIIKNL